MNDSKPAFFTAAAVFLFNAVSGAVALLILLLAMNGYGESDALWGLAGFVVLAFAAAMAASVFAFFTVRRSSNGGRRGITIVAAGLAGISIGVLLQAASAFVGILIAEIIRTHF